jgi:hypothetical protein
MTPITEEGLLALGFIRRPSAVVGYILILQDTDQPKGESLCLLLEKGNKTDESCWNMVFVREERSLFRPTDRVTLRHGIRFIEEIERFILLWDLEPPPVITPIAGSSAPRDGHLKIEWLPDPRFAKGGQHVGVPERRLRVTHLPTMLVVERWVDRSQSLALFKAKSMLEWGLAKEGWVEREDWKDLPDNDEGFGYASWAHLKEKKK